MTTRISNSGIDLISTTKANQVRNFVTYNDLNLNKIDNLIGTGVVSSFTPTLSSPQDEPPSLGDNSIIKGQWIRMINLVFYWGRLEFGDANVEAGSGSNWFTITLPIPADPGLRADQTIGEGATVGNCAMRDISDVNNLQTGTVQLHSTTTVMFATNHSNNQRAVRHNVPFTWNEGDLLAWMTVYPGVI